jgi:hypothetical protein
MLIPRKKFIFIFIFYSNLNINLTVKITLKIKIHSKSLENPPVPPRTSLKSKLAHGISERRFDRFKIHFVVKGARRTANVQRVEKWN